MKITFARVIKITPKPFPGDDGEEIYYCWIKAETVDGVTMEFGTKRDDYSLEDKDFEIEIESSTKYDKAGKPNGLKHKEVL